MLFEKLRNSLLLILFSIAAMVACDLSDTNQTGRIKVTMTDAPANYEAVWIDVDIVTIHKASDDNNEEDGWKTISDESQRVNLLDLRNGNEVTLGETELETGMYSQLRLILGTENEVMIDGDTLNLSTPSAQQSGLKVNINAEIHENESFELLIDFDVAQSIVRTGNGMYILKPVLRTVDQSESGSITGDVEPADFLTTVTAINEDDSLSTITGNDGQFKIMGVAPGTYKVLFEPDSDQYQDTTLTDVEVSAREETDLETINLNPVITG